MTFAFSAADSTGPIVKYLNSVIGRQLRDDKRVLWLVAGGSSAPIAIATAKLLVDSDAPLGKLVVSLTDERYGDVGHADSNWKQLMDLGFDLPGAILHPVLSGKDRDATVADFEKFLQTELDEADYKIGLFGIGADGHTSGILPHSSAVRETRFVHGYDGGTFQRVTTTPAALARLDEAVVYSVGEAKWPQLDRLKDEVTLDDQPAQALKQIPKVTIFTDKEMK